jgi:LPS export ABC transporter protein LptC
MKWSLIIVIGAVCGGIWLSNVTWRHRPHNRLVSVTETLRPHKLSPDICVEDMYLLEQAGFIAAWEVVAKKAEVYNTEQLAVLHQFHARLSGQPAEPMQMTAAQGQIDHVTGDIAVRGDVRLHYQEGYTIETEALYWYATDRVLYTEALVKMRNPLISIVGMGLHSNVDQHRIALQHSVQASFQLP